MELLQAVRADIAAIRSETRERLTRLEARIGGVETHLAGVLVRQIPPVMVGGADSQTTAALARRLERLEARVEGWEFERLEQAINRDRLEREGK